MRRSMAIVQMLSMLWVLWTYHAEPWHFRGVLPMSPGWFSTTRLFTSELNCMLAVELEQIMLDHDGVACVEAGEAPPGRMAEHAS